MSVEEKRSYGPIKSPVLRRKVEVFRTLRAEAHLPCLAFDRHCPWQAAIADPVERRMGSEHAAQIRSAFGFGDADQLKQVIVAAGFRGVEIRVERETNRHASIAEYVPGYIRRPLSQQPLLAWIRRHKQRLPPT